MSKPVGENTVAFRTGEVGHGLEAVRKEGGGSDLENGGNKFFRNASNKKRYPDVRTTVLVLGEVSKQLRKLTQRHVRPSVRPVCPHRTVGFPLDGFQ
jgi:hypothetical protein